MTNEQKWLLQEMYDEGYRDIKIIGVYAYFVNPTFIENDKSFKVRDHTPRIPCKVLGLSHKPDKYSIGALLGIVEWENVPVDTPVIAETACGIRRRYFAKYAGGKIWYFCNGATSWSAMPRMVTDIEPRNVRLAENGRD